MLSCEFIAGNAGTPREFVVVVVVVVDEVAAAAAAVGNDASEAATPPSTDTRAAESLFENELERWRDEIDDERLRPSGGAGNDADTAAATEAADGGGALGDDGAVVVVNETTLAEPCASATVACTRVPATLLLALRELPSLASRTRRCRASFSLLADDADGLMSPNAPKLSIAKLTSGSALPAVVTFDADRDLLVRLPLPEEVDEEAGVATALVD
jgi:hypothetical protein